MSDAFILSLIRSMYSPAIENIEICTVSESQSEAFDVHSVRISACLMSFSVYIYGIDGLKPSIAESDAARVRPNAPALASKGSRVPRQQEQGDVDVCCSGAFRPYICGNVI